MEKREIILLGLKGGEKFTPVQVQKLFFLIDKKVGNQLGGPFFAFKPYDYGPFDKAIYMELEHMCEIGMVEIGNSTLPSQRYYCLTARGVENANAVATTCPPQILDYIRSLGEFVRSLSFKALIASIYEAYPEMKINSVVFKE